MVENGHSRKSKKQKYVERCDEIAGAIESYINERHITTGQYEAQAVHMKTIEKHLIGLTDRPALKHREIVQVKVLNGISPKELFVMKSIDERHANQFHRDFHRDYDDNEHDLVICLKTGIFCVAKTASNGWQRCRILRLHAKNVCTAFLLDIGRNEHVKWSDLRILDEKWCSQKPFAIRCAMVDMVSARPIDRCTLQQQRQLMKSLATNETFYISVSRPGTISTDIFLYTVDHGRFDCVNEIFPSCLWSTDDDDDYGDGDDDTTLCPRASSDGTAVSANDADEPTTNEVSMLDENQNEAKMDNKMNDNDDQSVSNQPISSNQQRLTKPEDVIVQHIDETGAIFVNIKKWKKALDTVRFKIQQHMLNAEHDDHCDGEMSWNVNDYCLLFGKFDGFTEWVRGKITSISIATAPATHADQLAQVYLRDVGKSIEIPLRELRPSHGIPNVQDFAWKTQLAFIEIKERDGQTSWIIKVLKKMMKAYEKIAISVVGSTGDQLNVILWGIIRNVRAMLPEKVELTNINEELVNRGYAVASIDFNGINDLIGGSMNATTTDSPYYDSDNFQPNSSLQSEYAVTEERMDVTEWLPSEPISQREFAAYPMYVSHKCVLSILEANRRSVADEMKAILERKHQANELERRDATEWKKEDPCFVRFSADGRFYRGSVRRVNLTKNTGVVRFIDYGNCTPCSLNDLRKATMFGNIPELTRQYQLDNVRPFTDDGKWPEDVRLFCSETVVERQCNVIVTDELAASKMPFEPIQCKLEIFTKDIDLASALVARKMAKWIQ